MPNRKYKTDPNQLLAEGQMIINTTDDAKFQHRVELVNLVLGGLSPSFLSQYCAESKNTITSWVKTADEQGFDALRIKKQSGRPSKLSSVQLAQIRSILARDTPKEYGYPVWDGPSLSDYIAKTYSVSLCVRQCQRLLHTLGFSLVRPRYFPARVRAMSRSVRPLKKTKRACCRPGGGGRIPGRGTFPGNRVRYEEVGSKGFPPAGKVCPGA